MAIKAKPDFHFSISELGGALGDLGTLLPILVALIAINGLNPVPVLLLVGLAYLATGFYYRLPLPVQPLKAVSAVAIARGLPAAVISLTGLLMGATLFLLAATGWIDKVGRLFSRPVVRGIQLGVGLLLLRAGFSLVWRTRSVIEGAPPPALTTNLLLALAAAALLLTFLNSRRFPASLAVIGFGLGMGVLALPSAESSAAPAFAFPALPGAQDLWLAFSLLLLPQLPLTIGNACFATADTARAYFGEAARKVTPRRLLCSMGAMNLAAGVTGAMPLCHGSGGLTAHYRLGARSGAAPVMIGVLLLLVAVALNDGALSYLTLIPFPVLGVLLCFTGFQHAWLARDVPRGKEMAIVALIALTTLLTSNLALGFAAGIALDLLLRLGGHWQQRRGKGYNKVYKEEG